MLVLYLVLQLAASSEALHHCVHEDSHAPDHQCVIKLVADGQLLVISAAEFNTEPSPEPLAAPVVPALCFSSVDRLLPPGRAPPAGPA